MLAIKAIIRPTSLEEAFDLVQDNSCRILGGGAFLRLSNDLTIQKAVDLESLDLKGITEYEDHFEIGAMTSIRALETHDGLNHYFNHFLSDAVGHIVGVQLRNIATVGGTIYPKYGFSDLITSLLALDTTVVLVDKEMPLTEFLETPIKNNIIRCIKISKNNEQTCFKMVRNSKADFAMLNIAVSKSNNCYKISVGARPSVASLAYKAMAYLNSCDVLTEEHIDETAILAMDELSFGDNRLASGFYRKAMCKVMIKRALMEVLDNEN